MEVNSLIVIQCSEYYVKLLDYYLFFVTGYFDQRCRSLLETLDSICHGLKLHAVVRLSCKVHLENLDTSQGSLFSMSLKHTGSHKYSAYVALLGLDIES